MRITIDTFDEEGNKTGNRNATTQELKDRVKNCKGQTAKKAVLDLIDLAGGFDNLSDIQFKKIVKWLLYKEENEILDL